MDVPSLPMALALPSLPQRRGEEDGKSAHTRGISLRIAEDGRHGGYGCSGHPTEVSQDMRLVSDSNDAAARSLRPPAKSTSASRHRYDSGRTVLSRPAKQTNLQYKPEESEAKVHFETYGDPEITYSR